MGVLGTATAGVLGNTRTISLRNFSETGERFGRTVYGLKCLKEVVLQY